MSLEEYRKSKSLDKLLGAIKEVLNELQFKI